MKKEKKKINNKKNKNLKINKLSNQNKKENKMSTNKRSTTPSRNLKVEKVSNQKKIRLKKKNIAICIMTILFIILFIVSLIHIIKWKVDSNKTKEQIETINDNVIIDEVEDDENTEIVNEEEKKEDKKNDPYWDYIKMNLINVDFKDLKKTNSDTKGWIKVNGTNINYPFVQAKDNKYYLTRSFDKKYNEAGWVFLDYRNNISGSDKNTIIYAHGRTDQTMFGSLPKILKNSWLKNKDNHVVKLSTQYENTLWQVFSVYKIKTTNDYIQVDFSSDEEFVTFANMLIKRSKYKFNTSVSKNDRILTLSSCYSNTEKIVLHAKLIKKTSR